MTQPTPPPSGAAGEASVVPVRPRRRWRRRLLVGGGLLLGAAGAVGYWALDEYVIDHVEIADVSAHEAALSTVPRAAATTVPAAATAPAPVTTTASSRAQAAAPFTTAAPATTLPVTAAPTTSAGPTTTMAPVLTDSTYRSARASISISKVVTGTGADTVTAFVADVVLTDATALRAGFAQDKYGENIVADTSDIARDRGAVFAVNGDYYGFRDDGIMIRNGVIYRDAGKRTGLALYADGRMEVYDEKATTAQQLLDAGVWNTLSFGPALLHEGKVVDGIDRAEVDTNVGNHSIQGNQPRTALGMIAPNHFVLVVVDGRARGYSRGVTLPELAAMFQRLGATEAYNLDGGGSSTMWFAGELVNDPLGKGRERGTSDILYVG